MNLKRSTLAYLNFTKTFFKKNFSKSDSERESLLNSIALLNLNSKSFDICESKITEKDIITAVKKYA